MLAILKWLDICHREVLAYVLKDSHCSIIWNSKKV